MLSERPNVRVHNDPLRMCPARESRLQSGRETQGRLSWGYHFFGGKEGVRKKSFYCSVKDMGACRKPIGSFLEVTNCDLQSDAPS